MPSIAKKIQGALKATASPTIAAPDLAEAGRIAQSLSKACESHRAIRSRMEASAGSLFLRQREAAKAAEQQACADDARFANEHTRRARAKAEADLAEAEAKHQAQAPLDRADHAEAASLSGEALRLTDAARQALADAVAPVREALEAELTALAQRYASAFRLHQTMLGGDVHPGTAVPLLNGSKLFISDCDLLPEHRAIIGAIEPISRIVDRGNRVADEARQSAMAACVGQPLRAAG
ncbi:hypothetical protein [Labrys sp. (in: a-proteobacteria)]|uniref:hypothetical protein n=1 Tax=Labrys sp. (in: a-proteobacteria) TaxID=1917972 RepID=UPI0039E31E43